MSSTSPPPLYTLITNTRTASNLAVKILNPTAQPSVHPAKLLGGYYFFPALMKANSIDVRGKPVSLWTASEHTQMASIYQSCFDSFVAYHADATAAGKHAFAKEHANFFFGPTSIAEIVSPGVEEEGKWMMKFQDGREGTRSSLNETVMPDEFLNVISPVFLIRHPALSFPSFERQMRGMPYEIVKSVQVERRIAMTYKFTRSLFAYFTARFEKHPAADGVKWPLVIDADDLIQHEELVVEVGELMGMGREKMRFTWEKATQEYLDGLPTPMLSMLGTLHASTGIQTDKLSKGIDIDVEAKKWKVEFGEEAGKEIEELVRVAMPDYEFLKGRRMLPKAQMNGQEKKDPYSGYYGDNTTCFSQEVIDDMEQRS
ncbi:hypothetical protein GLAREA_00950 [Glarea lozoyensis ATCC 20868]|uniref:P-loop containing nucleoside triphosphate hydrolase n=1 Tax=Glarea lozoyensis (strain ATCC 20868 / MF5171) TaxID=1116229 RepID=S3CW03_GLAL2|nr:uncharacterized protein GLAREA_00950 [Glarea lozoyensis ATCC 20868]EPE29790.1 hypothetical protein GLAREA_00950 [Glarea lozoyensis ATCC 20868]